MGKKAVIEEFTNLLAVALRHRIGSIVNNNEIYAQKYARDAEILINEAKKIVIGISFNIYEKKEIREKLEKKLKNELESKTFIDSKKFEIIGGEIEKALREII